MTDEIADRQQDNNKTKGPRYDGYQIQVISSAETGSGKYSGQKTDDRTQIPCCGVWYDPSWQQAGSCHQKDRRGDKPGQDTVFPICEKLPLGFCIICQKNTPM